MWEEAALPCTATAAQARYHEWSSVQWSRQRTASSHSRRRQLNMLDVALARQLWRWMRDREPGNFISKEQKGKSTRHNNTGLPCLRREKVGVQNEVSFRGVCQWCHCHMTRGKGKNEASFGAVRIEPRRSCDQVQRAARVKMVWIWRQSEASRVCSERDIDFVGREIMRSVVLQVINLELVIKFS